MKKTKKNDYEFKLVVENLPSRNMPLNPVSNVSYKNNNKIMINKSWLKMEFQREFGCAEVYGKKVNLIRRKRYIFVWIHTLSKREMKYKCSTYK